MNLLARPRAALGRLRRSPARLIGSILGAGLFVAAIWAAASKPGAWEAVASARGDWRLWSLAIGLPLLNLLLVAMSFWALLNRFGRVEPGETVALISSAWLLNYLPMRPGLVGRVAYHKVVNRISVRASAGITVLGLVCSGTGAAIALGVTILLGTGATALMWVGALSLPAVAIACASAALWASHSPMWRLGAALALRYVDLLVWAGRYGVTFALVGSPISVDTAVALAVASQIAMLVPVAGNGLGLREWAIGLTAASLAAAPTEAGLAADLVNRAAEVLAAVPAGLLGARAVSRRLRAHRQRRAQVAEGIGREA
ncbi:MAG: hypothetical protein ACF8R7_04995 [Phycisphaerales bacterium JB039]